MEPADEQLVRERELRALPFARDGGADQPHGPAARKLPFGPTTKHTRVELESYLRPELRDEPSKLRTAPGHVDKRIHLQLSRAMVC